MKLSTMSGALKFTTVIYLLFSTLGMLSFNAIGFRSQLYIFGIAYAEVQLLWEVLCPPFIVLYIAAIILGIHAIKTNRYRLYTLLVWTDCLATLALILSGYISFVHSIWINALYGVWLLWELHLDREYVI